MRAMMSFPVPLSPWISTGTFAPANFVNRSRTACIASVCPKIIDSGGISPKGWTSVFTLVVVMDGIWCLGEEPQPQRCTRNATTLHISIEPSNLDYALENDQLTKECAAGVRVINL